MSKYHKQIRSESVDVYDVLVAFGVTNPAVQHAIKKLLAPGQRGYKDAIQDLTEARQSIDRAIEIEKGSSFAGKLSDEANKAIHAATEDKENDRMIPWRGGNCPTQADVIVDYETRNGGGGRYKAVDLDWRHTGRIFDIVAYRVVK